MIAAPAMGLDHVHGIVTVLLRWMIWSEWPVSGTWAVGTLVGVRLLMTGITMITLGSAGTAVGRAAGGR